MKALFLTADLGGNVPPTLAVAMVLSHRNVKVEVAGLAVDRTTLPRVPFPAATAIRQDHKPQGITELGALSTLMTGRRTSAAAGSLITQRRPDVVVVDCMVPAMLRGALKSEAPVVVLFHTFGAFWRTFNSGAIGTYFALHGLRPGPLWSRAAARLILSDQQLDPGGDDAALSGFIWTGTTEAGAEPTPDRTRPRVLVALSSSPWPGMLRVYRRIVSALDSLPVDAVVTTGGVDLGGQLTGGHNIEVRGYVPHHELLPTVDLVIGHGGHSTTLKALAHGVPLLILPVNPTADQYLVGQTLQTAGLGRLLAKSASPAAIREAVSDILADAELQKCAAETGQRLRSVAPGAETAADHILRIMYRSR